MTPDPDILRTQIKRRLAELHRTDSKWTQAELARRSKISRHKISDYLAGKKDMTDASLNRILTALKLRDLVWHTQKQKKSTRT